MISLDELRLIPFPNQDDLDWCNWPSIPDNLTLPPEMEYWFAGDMVQLGVIWHRGVTNIFICNQHNRIGFLSEMLAKIFPGTFIWYDLGGALGVHDYFWYSYSVECEYENIEDLPDWCQKTWDIFLKEKLIECVKDAQSEEVFYYVEDYEHLSKSILISIYQQLRPLFINEIKSYQLENGDEEAVDEKIQMAENIFEQLIDNLNQ